MYEPKDCEHLVLSLKDNNLTKLDNYGTSQLIAFLLQVLSYGGFYDTNVEWVRLENIEIVGSTNAVNTPGRHKPTPRFTSVVRVCSIGNGERLIRSWAYEACRLFRDRLVSQQERNSLDNILLTALKAVWSSDIPNVEELGYYVTMASSVGSAPDALLPHLVTIGQITSKDLTSLIDKAINRFMHEQRQLDIVLFRELLELILI